MLRDMVAIIGRENKIGIIKDTIISQPVNETFNKFIYRLERLKTSSVEFIVVCDNLVSELV